jgi:hypothetical protein
MLYVGSGSEIIAFSYCPQESSVLLSDLTIISTETHFFFILIRNGPHDARRPFGAYNGLCHHQVDA